MEFSEVPAPLDSRLAVSKINSVKLRQNNFLLSKALFNEYHSKGSYRSLYNLDEWASNTVIFSGLMIQTY